MIDGAPVTQPRRSGDIDEAFLDLVCSDEEWLRAEFDAIVESGWGSGDRPPPRPASPTPPPRPPGRTPVGQEPANLSEPGRALVRRVARQRGPPAVGAHIRTAPGRTR
ncbi:MAG: hypothetical protein M3400_04935 [Actinomycetota bacterium]|nr:hypothetical protein [Actinomycetota bacterium]